MLWEWLCGASFKEIGLLWGMGWGKIIVNDCSQTRVRGKHIKNRLWWTRTTNTWKKPWKLCSRTFPYIPDGGKSAGNGMEVLQIVVGMGEGKTSVWQQCFLSPRDREHSSTPTLRGQANMESAAYVFVLIRYLRWWLENLLKASGNLFQFLDYC